MKYDVHVFKSDELDGKLVEIWRLNDAIHRENGPARVVYGESGDIITQVWYRQNKLHRIAAPAILHNDGGRQEECWYENGIAHRVGAPAIVRTYNNIKTSEIWSLATVGLHRLDGPALFECDPSTGVVTQEEWHVNGRRHRTNGPALVHRNSQTGEIYKSEFWQNGRRRQPNNKLPVVPPPG